jgi:hypothetical protein
MLVAMKTNYQNFIYCSVLSIFGLFALNVRLGTAIFFNPIDSLWSDPSRHWENATEVFGGSMMAAIDPIGFQVWLGLVSKLTLDIPILVGLYAGLLSIVTPWVWYRFLREMCENKRIAQCGGLVLLCLPSWIGIFSYFMTETLLLPLMGLSLWMSMRSVRKRTQNAFLIAGLCWTFCGLTRGVAIPIAAVFTIAAWLHQPAKIQSAATLLALIAMILLPLSYRNNVKTGSLVPWGDTSLAQVYALSGKKQIDIFYCGAGVREHYYFVSPSMNYRPFLPFSDWKSQRDGRVEVYIDQANPAQDWGDAVESLKPTLSERFDLIGENLIFLFFGRSWPDHRASSPVERFAEQMRFVWLPLTILTLSASCVYWRLLGTGRILVFAMVVWFIFQGLMLMSVGEGRYRKPFEGMIIAQAVILCDRLAKRRRMNHVT